MADNELSYSIYQELQPNTFIYLKVVMRLVCRFELLQSLDFLPLKTEGEMTQLDVKMMYKDIVFLKTKAELCQLPLLDGLIKH